MFEQHTTKTILSNESGTFYLDENGIAFKFEPAVENPYCLDEYE